MNARARVLGVTTLLLMAGAAWAQQPSRTIAIAVETSDGRVQPWLRDLRREAAGVVEHSARNANVIVVSGSPTRAADEAAKNSADYLLRIDVAVRPYTEVAIGREPPIGTRAVGEPRANAVGQVVITWSVESLADNNIRLKDTKYVQSREHPLGPSFDWLRGIVFRSVRDTAASAVGALKKKKGL